MNDKKGTNKPEAVFNHDFFSDLSSMVESLEEEGKKKKKINQDDDSSGKSHVVRLIYENALQCIRQKDFHTAELLRNQLYQIDETAIKEIYELGRIIETGKRILEKEIQEKPDPIPEETSYHQPEVAKLPKKVHTLLPLDKIDGLQFSAHWFDFFNGLDNRELSALSKCIRYLEAEEMIEIISQEEINDKLCFVYSGGATLSSRTNKSTIKTHSVMKTGDVFGDDTCFSAAPSSVTAIIHENSQILILFKDDLDELKKQFPNIDRKLFAICFDRKQNNPSDSSSLIPRFHRRYPVSGGVSVQRLDTGGRPVGRPFSGKIIDISQGGMAFEIKKANDDFMKQLQGQRLNTAIDIDMDSLWGDLLWSGEVVGVNNLKDRSYSIHLKGYGENPELSSLLNKIRAQYDQV